MADYCCFCDTRRPEGGTQHLVLNGGQLWLEFCSWCGDREWLSNPLTGENITVANLMRRAQGEEEREPTQSYQDWLESTGSPSPEKPKAAPKPHQPTLADVWPSS